MTNPKTTEKPDLSSRDATPFDLLIIGAGSAGFAAALRAVELGAKAAIVERGALGGTCVNRGCVPSKTLIRAAEVHHRAGHHAFKGIHTNADPPDLRSVIEQKRQLVTELRHAKYRDVLASNPKITLLRGDARLRPDGDVEVDGTLVRAAKVLLSMGASPWTPPIPGLSDIPHLTSTSVMELERLPNHLIIIGAGAVGMEFAQTFARLGSKVTVIEALGRILPTEDPDIADALADYAGREGIEIRTRAEIASLSGGPGSYAVEIQDESGHHFVHCDQILVATGRRPNTSNMGLEEAGITLGRNGRVLVDEHLKTSAPHIYAAGDVIGDPAFVYVAAYAGNLAADNAIRGDRQTYDLSVVPRVTFTDPAVASVGLTEEQARAQDVPVSVSNLPMSFVPRAIAARDTRGFIKLIANKETGLLVGAHILAPEAGEMVQQAVMAIRFGITIDEIASLLHPYLTNAEGFKLACQTFKKDITKLSCCAS